MKKFAIGHYKTWDDELTVEIIEADNVFDALHKHTTIDSINDAEVEDWINEMKKNKCTITAIKESFSCVDQAIDILEI